MIKLTKEHSIYEVWCEYTAESVFIDHKPTKEELEEIRIKNWNKTDQFDMPFILQVFKASPFYTSGGVKFGNNPKTGKVQVIKGNKVIGEQG